MKPEQQNQWTPVRSLCQIQFKPSEENHKGLLLLVNALGETYPQVQQQQLQPPPPRPGDKENAKPLQAIPQWLLRSTTRPQQVAVQPQAVTLEELEPGSPRSVVIEGTESLWQTTCEHMQPAEVARIGLRHVQAFMGPASLADLLLDNPYVPSCLLDQDRRGHSRVELEVDPGLRAIVILGRNQNGFPVLDIDLILEKVGVPFWPEVRKNIDLLYQEMDRIMENIIRDFQPELALT